MTINIDQTSSNRYRRLADSGIYDDFYPLRANACFHILDKTNNGTFNLQSFIENVKYISSYLSIYMDTSSDFAIMSEFLSLDRSGIGSVNIDSFIAGLICKLSKLSNNDFILKSITEELIPGTDCKTEDLIRFLQSPSLSNLNDSSFYRLHFQSYTNLLLDYLFENNIDKDIINHDNMKIVLRKTIKRVIAELQNHFHLSSERLEQLLSETTEPLTSKDFEENYQTIQMNAIKWNVDDLRISNDSCNFKNALKDDDNDDDDDENDENNNGNTILDKSTSMVMDNMIKTDTIMNTNSLDHINFSSTSLDEIDMSGFDKTQLFLLNTAFKSLKSFFNLTLVKNEESNLSLEQVSKIENIAKELKKFNFHYDLNTDVHDDEELKGQAALMLDLASTKEELKRALLRTEVLEIGQLASKASIFDKNDIMDIDLQNTSDNYSVDISTESKTIMFDDMMKEIEQLRVCVAERGNGNMVLGSLLQNDFACIDNRLMKHTVKEIHRHTSHIQKKMIEFNNENRRHKDNNKLTEMQELDLVELHAMKEQILNERGEHLSRSVELQVLREEVHRLKVSNEELKKYEAHCIELTLKSNELRSEKINNTKTASANELSSKNETELNSKLSEEIKKYNKLKSKYENISVEHQRIEKENNRLSGLLKASEERTKHMLQDHMVINNQLHNALDELAANKTFATKLLLDLDNEGKLQRENEELSQKVLELNIEVEKLKSKVSENDSISTISSKYMNELSLAEKKIDELENKISELIIAVEKGNVATEQLEIFREQLRSKSKENSEFSLILQSMDLKVKDKEQTKVANKELSRELAEYKVKIDKVPGLLTEIARLRGTSRASTKALSEQDKYLYECKQRIKELERLNTKLSNELRLYKDSDSKLKEVSKQLEDLQIKQIEDLQIKQTEVEI